MERKLTALEQEAVNLCKGYGSCNNAALEEFAVTCLKRGKDLVIQDVAAWVSKARCLIELRLDGMYFSGKDEAYKEILTLLGLQ